MAISERMSREELVEMYEFCAVQLVDAQKENKNMRDALQKISKYEETGDKSFDIKMIKVIASVAVLN